MQNMGKLTLNSENATANTQSEKSGINAAVFLKLSSAQKTNMAQSSLFISAFSCLCRLVSFRAVFVMYLPC